MSKRALVIFNPVSGRVRLGRIDQQCKRILQNNDFEYDWFTTIPVKKQPLSQFKKNKYDLIIAIGGDGTVREAAEFILKNRLDVPLAIVPTGSFNILATSLGVPILPWRAVNFALLQKPMAIDVGKVNNHYFFIGAGKGFDALLMKDASRRLKRLFGFFAYIFSFIKTFFSFRKADFKVEINGEKYSFRARTVVVFNILSVFGFRIGPKVSPVDGFLTICVASPVRIWDTFWFFVRFFLGQKNRHLRVFKGKKIVLESRSKRILSQIDGESLKMGKMKLSILPRRLQVVCGRRSFD